MAFASKNILIVTHHYPPHITGVGFVAQNHAKRLAALGNKVTVITSDTSPSEKSYSADGVNVIRIKAWNISESWSAPFPIFSPTLLFVLLKHARHADIVHIHDSFYISSFFAAIVAKIYRKPIVLTQHVAMVAHPNKSIVAIEKIVYATSGAVIFRLSNLIITFNDRIERFLIEKGVPPEKMIVLFNGVDMEIFHPVEAQQKRDLKKQLGLSLNKKILLFVGRFVPKKGFDKVLAVHSKDYQIVCIGGESPKRNFGDDVVFLAKLDQKALAQVYQAADIFILPSKSEGFPLSIQEAMASGLPIITTNDPGYTQYKLDRKYISLIDHTDEKSIRDAIYNIYSNDELLSKMSVYSTQYAAEHFNWAAAIAQLDNVYDSLLPKKSIIPRLTVVSPYFYPKIGGLENIAYTTARSLHQSGEYQVSIITSNHDGKDYHREIIDGMVVHRLSIGFKISNTPINLLWYWQIKKIFKAEHPDIVHVHSPVPFIADVAARAAGKIPVILTYHSGSMRKSKWPVDFFILAYERIILRALFRKVSAIVAYSPEFVEGELAPFKYKTTVIPPGVDLSQYTPTPLPVDQKVVTFVGRIGHHTQWKGVGTLLQAISIVAKKHPDVQLKLVGEGDAIDYYRAMAIDLHIADHVSFPGPKRGEALAQAYKNTNVFVLPSTSNAESFGMVLLEAMASRRPVIGSNIGGIPQLIDNEKSGLLVPPKNPEALAHAIERILTDATLAERFAKESFIKAQQFSWDVQTNKYRELFSKVIIAKNRKKIAIVSDAVYPFNKGGKEKRLHDIATRLAAQGFDVTIYCMNWWHGEKTIIRNGVRFYAISPYYPLYAGNRRSISQATLFALHCFKLINKDFDVIDVDHMPHPVLFSMKIVCLLKGKPMIATWHEVWGKKYWKQYLGTLGIFASWIERVSVTLPDTIISVSDHTTRALRSMLGNEKEIITIPNGLDVARITNNTPASVGSDIIFAGRLLAHKNINVLLRAIHILARKNPNISLTIIGEGPERKRLEDLTRELGLDHNVRFYNFFENESELYQTIGASKVFVLPSTREGFGIVVLEANASGLPVVTIDHPENVARELIVEGKNGILTSLDENKMAQAIEQALQMKGTKADYRPYAEKYNWDSLISKVLSAYH